MFKKITSKLASLNVRSLGGKIATSVLMVVAMAMVAQSAQAAARKYVVSATRGTAWVNNYDIDWATEKLVVKVNLSSDLFNTNNTSVKLNATTSRTDEMLLAVCPTNQTAGWSAYNSLIYLKTATQIQEYAFDSNGNPLTGHNGVLHNFVSGANTFEYSVANGLKFNGTQIVTPNNLNGIWWADGNHTAYNAQVKVGVESVCSVTTDYEIWILPKDSDVPTDASISNVNITSGKLIKSLKENYFSPDEQWTINTPIDFSAGQKLIVSVDNSRHTYSSGSETIFGVCGSDGRLGWWERENGFNVYAVNSAQFNAWYFGNSSLQTNPTNYSNNKAVFEFSSNGLNINGTQKFTASQMSVLLNKKNFIIGNEDGNHKQFYYDYIRIVSSDFAATTTSSNTIKDDCINVFSTQNNVNVQLQRTLYADGWNTFCVPFNIDETTIAQVFGAGTKIRQYASMSDMTMNFEEATSIEAGKPYLIQPANDKKNPTFEGVDIVAGDPQTVGDGTYSMVGTYGLTTLATDGTNLFLGEGNKFYKPESESTATMNGMRAYFVVPAGTNQAALVANIDGTFTSIDQIDGAKVVENAPVYNLNGQRVGYSLQGLGRGIYVQNGKKYVVK